MQPENCENHSYITKTYNIGDVMNSCKKYQTRLVLFFYNELEKEDQLEMKAHISACAFCQEQLKALEQLQKVKSKQVNNTVLKLTRLVLFYKLRKISNTVNHQKVNRDFPKRVVIQIGFAMVLILFGFFLGRSKSPEIIKPAFTCQDIITADRVISTENTIISPYLFNIEKIKYNPITGIIDLQFSTINEILLRGPLENPAIHQMVQRALMNEENFSAKLQAAKAVYLMAQTSQRIDNQLLLTMDQLLGYEQNIGIKRNILKALDAAEPTPEIQSLLIRTMLSDSSEALRIQAFKALTKGAQDQKLADQLLTKTKLDSNAYIRTKSLELLKDKKETLL